LLVTETVSNFLCFSKAQFCLVFVMVALGRYMARRNVKEFILAGVGIVCLYLVVGPLVSWGRDEIVRETGDSHKAPFGLRFNIALRGLELGSRGALDRDDTRQDWWGRLCYTNQQAAGMNLYDAGSRGDSF